MPAFRVHLDDDSVRDIDAATAADARRKVDADLKALPVHLRPSITKIKLLREDIHAR